MGSYYTYILYSEKLNKYYIGYSGDLQERLIKHNRSTKGFTATGKPWILKYHECFQSKELAMKREKQLKKWKNTDRIEKLINSHKDSEHPDKNLGETDP